MSTDDLVLKEKLLKKCIEIKEESASNIQAAMDDAQQSANEYGPPKDRYDSFRAQLMRKRDMLGQQFSVVQEELRYLRQMKPNVLSSCVESGALVFLPSQTLFVSMGIGKIEIEGKPFYAISPLVPIAEAMKNLKQGESFVFRGTEMEILGIC